MFQNCTICSVTKVLVKALTHGAIFLANLQRNSTFGRCKIGKCKFPSEVANIYKRLQLILITIRVIEINGVAFYLTNFIIPRSLINNNVFQFVLPQLGNQNELVKKLT